MDNLGNECAFPGMEYDETAGQRYHYGITIRDYFAGQALNGMLSRNAYEGGWCPSKDGVNKVAKFSYEYADAMLKARKEAQ